MHLIKTFKKLAQQLHEALPANQCIYYIYTHRNGFDRFYNGLKANTELSYWGYHALREAYPRVRFLRLEREKQARIARIRPQDVVIGHIGETFLAASRQTKRLIAFAPWNGHQDQAKEAPFCVPKEVTMGYYDLAASTILLTSEFNTRTYLEKDHNFWYPYFQDYQKSKRLRIVHQPVDLDLFKRIKWAYATDDFLYIGNDAHMKCLGDSQALVRSVGRQLTLYGVGERRIDHRNEKEVASLPKKADFFIQPGMWEAQCVAILEAAARGFIPVVSPDTGYPYDHPYLLRYGDFEYNLGVLKKLLKTGPQERRELGDHLHKQLTEDLHHNNWRTLTDVLVEEVRHLACTDIAP